MYICTTYVIVTCGIHDHSRLVSRQIENKSGERFVEVLEKLNYISLMCDFSLCNSVIIMACTL